MSLRSSLIAVLVLLVVATSAMAQATAAPAAKQAKVVMLGDSITKFGLPEAVSAPPNEATKGKVAWTLVNAGVGGETAAVGKTRLAGLLQTEKPDLVTISYGLNDLARNDKPEDFRNHLIEMIDLVAKQSPNTRVILFTATPFDPRHSLSKNQSIIDLGGADLALELKFNSLVRQLAAEKNLPLIDLHRYVLTDPEWNKYIKPDGVHFTDDGYAFCSKHVVAALTSWYQTEVARETNAVKLRDKSLTQLKAMAADAAKGLDRPGLRNELLVKLVAVWQACPTLPQQAALWHSIYYSGKSEKKASDKVPPPAPAPAKPGASAEPRPSPNP